MISLIVTIVIFLLLAVIMEVASTALRMTGLDIHSARFQALSALTGTGFTTKETELVMQHKQRRVIVMILMVIGPIGFITILCSILFTSQQGYVLYQLLALTVLSLLVLKITKSKRTMAIFHSMVEHTLKKRHYPRRIVLEEVLQLNENYGVCEIKVDKYSSSAGKTLSESNFKEKEFLVLAIQRNHSLISVPKAQDKILEGDILVIFGNLHNLRDFARK